MDIPRRILGKIYKNSRKNLMCSVEQFLEEPLGRYQEKALEIALWKFQNEFYEKFLEEFKDNFLEETLKNIPDEIPAGHA